MSRSRAGRDCNHRKRTNDRDDDDNHHKRFNDRDDDDINFDIDVDFDMGRRGRGNDLDIDVEVEIDMGRKGKDLDIEVDIDRKGKWLDVEIEIGSLDIDLKLDGRCLQPDNTPMTAMIGGEGTAIGEDTLVDANIFSRLIDFGSVTIGFGTTTFNSAAVSEDGMVCVGEDVCGCFRGGLRLHLQRDDFDRWLKLRPTIRDSTFNDDLYRDRLRRLRLCRRTAHVQFF